MVAGILIISLIVIFLLLISFRTSAKTFSGDSVPKFDHVVMITFENREYYKIIGNPMMPTFNYYAFSNTLLTQYYAITHPSLPNYLAMIGGDTFDVTENCDDCFVDAPSLPDLMEANNLTWKTYQEDMETPCGLGSQDESEYVQKHNPFVYFDSIRNDNERCRQHVVPLNDLWDDVDSGQLPNYIFITPNMCHNAHDCWMYIADNWLRKLLDRLIPALEDSGDKYLIVLNWDEGNNNGSCCGLPESAGGRIAVVLISPQAKKFFQDDTPYSHYSLLKAISNSWDLPYLGHAADEATPLILAPWE